MGWLTGYSHRRPITIGAAAGAGTDYQVKVTALYAAPIISSDSYGALFCSSFEAPGFSDWDAPPFAHDAAGDVVKDWSTRGRWAFNTSGVGGFEDRAYLQKTIAASTDIYVACDVMLPAVPAFGAGEYINAVGPDLASEVGVLYDVNAQKWGIQWHDDHAAWSNSWQSGTFALAANTKYTVQIRVVIAAAGQITLWVDDALILDLTGINTSTTVTTTLFCGSWNNFAIGTDFSVYFDNYVASLTKIPYNQNTAHNGGEDLYCNAKCETDFDDIRFTSSDGQTPIGFLLAEKTDSSYATFYVKVPDNLTAGGATIYMYYGNSAVSSGSSGADTFLLFDHFDNASIGAEWTVQGSGTAVESGTVLTITANGGQVKSLYSATSFSYGTRAVMSFKRTGAVGNGFSNSVLNKYILANAGGVGAFNLQNADAGAETLTNAGIVWDTVSHLFEVRRISNVSADLVVDGVYRAVSTTNIPDDDLPVYFYQYNGNSNIVDWVGVAKYVSPEPALASGAEEKEDSGFARLNHRPHNFQNAM
jgi:hypothetical protein